MEEGLRDRIEEACDLKSGMEKGMERDGPPNG